MFFLLVEISVPYYGMYIPYFGTAVPYFGIHIPLYETKN